MKYFAFLFPFLTSCASVITESRQIKGETRKMVKSPPILYAQDVSKDLNYQLILKQNSSFVLLVFLNQTLKYLYYAGTFKRNKDTLHLEFYKNSHPELLTDKAFIDQSNNQVILIAKDTLQNKKLVITNSKITQKPYPTPKRIRKTG